MGLPNSTPLSGSEMVGTSTNAAIQLSSAPVGSSYPWKLLLLVLLLSAALWVFCTPLPLPNLSKVESVPL
eukprot:747937-Amphidinium_carterae.2